MSRKVPLLLLLLLLLLLFYTMLLQGKCAWRGNSPGAPNRGIRSGHPGATAECAGQA